MERAWKKGIKPRIRGRGIRGRGGSETRPYVRHALRPYGMSHRRRIERKRDRRRQRGRILAQSARIARAKEKSAKRRRVQGEEGLKEEERIRTF